MPITQTQLETRLVEARKQLELLRDQFNAVNGVIADLEYWLAQITTPDSPPSEVP